MIAQSVRCVLGALAVCVSLPSTHAQPSPPIPPPAIGTTLTDVPVHDPVMIREGDVYYLFATGRGIAVWSSRDKVSWTREHPVFASPPAWAVEAVPSYTGHTWAPDISYHNGLYYLYYSVSAFGKNTSCMGVATNVTLNRSDPRFRWQDHGKVIESVPGVHNWNAIDPNLVTDVDGTPYLAFGSFWEGLKLVRLTPDRLKTAEPLDALPTIASRRAPLVREPGQPAPTQAGSNPIEAPFIFRRGDQFYLFASIDYCCRGAQSTYKMIVGRSPTLKGPYVDRSGQPLEEGGGTLLLAGDERWHGVGHNAVVSFDGTEYLVFHAYDANDARGRAKLRIQALSWDAEGWPTVVLP